MMSSVRGLCYGVVSSWEPGTSAQERFATSLADSLSGRNEVAHIAASTPGPRDAHPSVAMASARPLETVAGELDRCDVAIIHHGVDDVLSGAHRPPPVSNILDVIDLVRVPTIVVLHHVPAEPTDDQRRSLAKACRSSDAVVVTTAPAGVRLVSVYGVDPSTLWLVRSGLTPHQGASLGSRRATVVTWGDVAPGSGIEWMIDAMEHLSGLDVRYLVAGPSSKESPGDEVQRYCEMLVRRCWSRRVPAYVSLGYDDADQTAMGETVRGAIALVVPQDIAGLHVDGFFEELVAAKVPIVATEAAAESAGVPSDAVLLVPRQNPGALADAVLRIMIDPHLAESTVRRAARLSPVVIRAGMAGRFARVADAALRSACRTRTRC